MEEDCGCEDAVAAVLVGGAAEADDAGTMGLELLQLWHHGWAGVTDAGHEHPAAALATGMQHCRFSSVCPLNDIHLSRGAADRSVDIHQQKELAVDAASPHTPLPVGDWSTLPHAPPPWRNFDCVFPTL